VTEAPEPRRAVLPSVTLAVSDSGPDGTSRGTELCERRGMLQKKGEGDYISYRGDQIKLWAMQHVHASTLW